MLSYWLRNFETWRDQVDSLIVYVNGPVNDRGLLRQMVTDMDGLWSYNSSSVGHGRALLGLLLYAETAGADHVVLCEDDAYVRRPNEVGAAFSHIDAEHFDVIGSPRYEDTVDRYEDWTDAHPLSQALWPAFLFARRDDLLATDRGFEDRIFRLGENVPGIGPVTKEMCEFVGVSSEYIHVDTFYATTYQLRDKRIELIHRTRVLQAEAAEDWIRYDPPWFHVSGLSAIGYVLAGQTTNLPDAHDWPRRVAWWERTYREADATLRDSAYGRTYRERMDAFREGAQIPAQLVDEWDARFEAWA